MTFWHISASFLLNLFKHKLMVTQLSIILASVSATFSFIYVLKTLAESIQSKNEEMAKEGPVYVPPLSDTRLREIICCQESATPHELKLIKQYTQQLNEKRI